MYNTDDLIHIVSGANMAGYLESKNEIYIYGDAEELTDFLVEQYTSYVSAIDCATAENAEYPVWFDWICDALITKYGTEQEKENV